jgi:hypothetical protein
VKVSLPSLNAVEGRFKSRVIGGVKVSVPSMGAVDHRFKSRVIGGVTASMPGMKASVSSLNAVDRRRKSLCDGLTRDLNLRSTAFKEGMLTVRCEG